MTFHPSGVFAVLINAFVIQAAQASDLTVSAAASLTNAMRDMAPLFEHAHPGTKVRLNFGASGALLQQIAKGAPADVFASADQETLNQAQAQGLIKTEQRRNFVSNGLVVIVARHASKAPEGLTDLTQPTYARIAMGLLASVPVGRYTKAVLEGAGLWGAIEPKMVGANTCGLIARCHATGAGGAFVL